MLRFRPAFRIERCINSHIRLKRSAAEKYGAKVAKNLEDRRARTPRTPVQIWNDDDAQQTPLALILGWNNCTFANLRTFSRPFDEKDVTILAVKSTMWSLLRRKNGMTEEIDIAMQILDDMTDMNDQRPLVIYSFSLAGSVMLYDFIRTLDSEQYPGKNIKGIIFDSSPVTLTSTSLSQLHNKYKKRYKPVYDAQIVSELYHKLVFRFSAKGKDFGIITDELKESPVLCPQLFLFSENDTVVDFNEVQDFMKRREELGVDVTHMLWNDSDHIEHRKKHDGEYKRIVSDFLDKCLGKNCS